MYLSDCTVISQTCRLADEVLSSQATDAVCLISILATDTVLMSVDANLHTAVFLHFALCYCSV